MYFADMKTKFAYLDNLALHDFQHYRFDVL